MLLKVNKLTVTATGGVELLHDISFSLDEGEVLGIIGESGSGKTTLARSLTNLFPDHVERMADGAVLFDGTDILNAGEEVLTELRRNAIRYIFQEPAAAMNPLLRIRSHFAGLSLPENQNRNSSAADTPEKRLARTGIPNPAEVLRSYPHQLSVGTLQRVLIALATTGSPKLLIADEPTSAVDAAMRYQILDLLHGECRSKGMALLITTHDLNLLRAYADTIVVLYAGRVVEVARAKDFFLHPLHPYSAMLLATRGDNLLMGRRDAVFAGNDTVEGIPMSGCRFSPRCPSVQEDCRSGEPELRQVEEGRLVRCPYWK